MRAAWNRVGPAHDFIVSRGGLVRQIPLGVRWRESSTFGSFVAGDNTLVLEALRAPRSEAAVIWIWGAAGTGRTHLLQASCAQAGERGQRAAYFPLLEHGESTPTALSGCEALDLVCLDDVEQVAGEAEWERALFNLYNGLQDSGGRLLLAAGRPPAAVPWRLADLKSRLCAGLTLALRPLSESQCTEVLQLRARNRGLDLPDETAAFLLRHYPRDLRSLCRLLDTLDAASLAAQRRLTVPFIKSAIAAVSPGVLS